MHSFPLRSQAPNPFSLVQDAIYISFCLIVFGISKLVWILHTYVIKLDFLFLICLMSIVSPARRRTLRGTGFLALQQMIGQICPVDYSFFEPYSMNQNEYLTNIKIIRKYFKNFSSTFMINEEIDFIKTKSKQWWRWKHKCQI